MAQDEEFIEEGELLEAPPEQQEQQPDPIEEVTGPDEATEGAAPVEDGNTPPEEGKPADEAAKMVPHETFHQAHMERQELRKGNRELQERYALLEQRTNAMLSQMQGGQQQAQPNPNEPPPADDPMARMDWIVNQLTSQREQEAAYAQQTEEQRQQEEYHNHARNTVMAEFQNELQASPELDALSNDLLNGYVQEALAQNATPQQAQEYAMQVQRQHIDVVYRNGFSPGEYLRKLASSRYLPNPAQPTPAPAPQQAAQPEQNGAEARRENHVSLSQTSGSEAMSGIDAKWLANASEEEFAQAERQYGTQIAKLMGGGI